MSARGKGFYIFVSHPSLAPRHHKEKYRKCSEMNVFSRARRGRDRTASSSLHTPHEVLRRAAQKSQKLNLKKSTRQVSKHYFKARETETKLDEINPASFQELFQGVSDTHAPKQLQYSQERKRRERKITSASAPVSGEGEK